MKHLLNENQKRSVAVTLRLLEERLVEVERLLTIQERGILYESIAHFSPRQIKLMRAYLAELRQEIAEMSRVFELGREMQDPARRIMGLMSVSWESLEELHGKPLRAYGAVDERLPAVIDPMADRLTRLTRDLQLIATQKIKPLEQDPEQEAP